MAFGLKPFFKWFGYSRRERRSSFLLLLIMILVIAARYTVPVKNITVDDLTASALTAHPEKNYPSDIKADTVLIIKHQIQRKKTDLNKCDSAELERLPGIGPVLAARIIKFRKLLGGFVSVDQLKEVYGLSDSTFSIISSRVNANPSDISFIQINKATYKELIRHPYFERYDVQAVIKYRELNGRINAFDDLIENKVITGKKTLKIRPYLVYD
jgi:DNA uptake protein ComE-like DNA-binding protein